MKERTKNLISGYNAFEEYDKEQKIREKYLKGCGYCKGNFSALFNRDYALEIKGNNLLLNEKDYDEFETMDDIVYSTYIRFARRNIGCIKIKFCPFCGKQLARRLK